MRLVRICTILAAAIICMTAACTDKGNGPTDAQYRLIVGPTFGTGDALGGHVSLFDTETDSLVDSVGCGDGAGYPYGTIGAPYVAVWCNNTKCFQVLDTRSLSVVATICGINDLYIDIEHDLIVGFRVIYEGGPYLAEAIIADLKDGHVRSTDTILTQAEIDSAGISHLVTEFIHPATGMAYGVVGYEGTFLTEVFAYDYIAGRFQKIWQIEPGEPEDRIPVNSSMFTLHPDGRRLYFVPLGWPDLFCFDLETEEILFRVLAPLGEHRFTRVNPAGTEVYVLAQGSPWGPPFYRKVAVYDAASGALVAEIPLDSTVLSDSLLPLFPNDIAFVPGTSKAYLASGLLPAGSKGVGKIVVLDTEERRVTGVLDFRFTFNGWPGQIWVLPLP